MKIKVLFIAPYTAMSYLMEDFRSEIDDIEVDVKVGNLEAAIPIAKRAEREGYDVIVSRGGTAKLIADVTNLPVIDVHISGYDMLRVLTLANQFPGKKAIVGFSNITIGAKTITDILEIPIDVYTVEKAEEVEPLILNLKKEEFTVIMGDVVTVNVADKFGLEGILIQSGREAIFDAFQRVRSLFDFIQKIQAEVSLLKSLLDKTDSDLVVFNTNQEVVFQQWHSLSPSEVRLEQLLASFDEETTVLLHLDDNEKVTATPSRILAGENEYTVFALSKLRRAYTVNKIKADTVQQPPMIIRESESMAFCLAQAEANLDKHNWALIGEKGTGKELLARFIHYQKFQGRGLFVKGSATEILSDFEATDQEIRTIFIYGVEQLTEKDLLTLMKLIQRTAQVIFILSLEEEHASIQSFLFHPFTARVYIPPLRERQKDIRALAAYFIADFHREKGTTPIKIKDEAVHLLEQYSWPGNVKELKALIQDAVLLEKRDVLDGKIVEHLLNKKTASKYEKIDESFLQGTLEDIEKRIIHILLEEEDGNQTKVAKRLGINRSTLWRKLKN
ncbi:sigma-54-dependent transcriptional regulator [Bacillus litorisediminis]|uniref:sigma-54-dependent transcriptional regulator n=1 Tax=Bacillus litorisediminis TaxID=2922713 RepID=UPI001FAD5FB5|nr:sigma-54-dependent transcriptional regulator [Bacillus litorisediminis]